VLVDHPVVHRRLFEGRQVLALEVLDDRDLERGVVVDLFDQRLDRREARLLRGAPAAFAGDQLVAVLAERSDEDRLQNAVLADRIRELMEGSLVEDRPRLVRVRLDPIERDRLDANAPTRVLGGQQGDDRRGELAIFGQASCGDGAEIRPGQGRSPPGRARDTCERLPTRRHTR
jgi:hypothetical protein